MQLYASFPLRLPKQCQGEYAQFMLLQIDAIYAQSRALESASQAATVLATMAGAKPKELQEVLEEAVGSENLGASKDPLQLANHHLAGRRRVCLAVTRLALRHGVPRKQLLEKLQQAGEGSATIISALKPSDLGI